MSKKTVYLEDAEQICGLLSIGVSVVVQKPNGWCHPVAIDDVEPIAEYIRWGLIRGRKFFIETEDDEGEETL